MQETRRQSRNSEKSFDRKDEGKIKPVSRKQGVGKIKKRSVSSIKKECDEIVKKIVKIRDNFTCQKCGKRVSGSDCQGSHVVPVSAGNKLAFDEQNIKVLCYHCHMNWWHKDPTVAGEWFKNKFPERHKYLQENRGIKQMKYLDWLELLDLLRKRFKQAETP